MANPPRIPGPGKSGFRVPSVPANPTPQIEVGKIDPKEIFEAQARAAMPPVPPPADPEKSLLERGERIDFKANREKAAARRAAEMGQTQQAEQQGPPKLEIADKPPPVIETAVSDDLIAQLEKEYGYATHEYTEVYLPIQSRGAQAKGMLVQIRLPQYEDWVWMLSVMERKIETGEDEALLQTALSRSEISQDLIACRCVVSIDGHWVWDVLKMRDQILLAMPDWDGKNYDAIPSFMKDALAKSIYHLFRKKFHPDLIFALSIAVRNLEKQQRETAAAEENADEDEEENPTEGP